MKKINDLGLNLFVIYCFSFVSFLFNYLKRRENMSSHSTLMYKLDGFCEQGRTVPISWGCLVPFLKVGVDLQHF